MKIVYKIIALSILVVVAGCASHKKIPYMMDSNTVNVSSGKVLYDARIMPKDLLSITVSSVDPAAAVPYNLEVPMVEGQSSSGSTYLVDNDGNILFPVLGMLHLGGLTKPEAEKYIVERLKPSFKEPPIVNVRLVNYKVSVLGEVARPGTFTVANEKINLFEALALAGDMTIYGKRDNVKLLREDNEGAKNIITLDLNRSDIVNSPYFYMQQNDVLYVEPNKAKAKNADVGQSTSLWISFTSAFISLANLVVTIVRLK